jgi:hypothetical protein
LAEDTLSYLGVNSLATNGLDARFDKPEPPSPFGDWVRLYFPHPEWPPPFTEFNADIRAPLDEDSTKIWTFEVQINHSTTVDLSWPDLSQVPGDYILLLIPGSKIDTINMRNASHYSFPAVSATYTFEASVENPGAPQCEVSPDSLDFGTVTVGDSLDRTFGISHTGGGTLSGTVSEACDDYSLVGDVTYSLTGGESKTFTVRFQPESAGVKNCTIETANGACADIGAVGVGCMEGVEVGAGGDESGYADSVVSIAFLVQNVGVVPDSFSLDISDTQGWNIEPLHYDLVLDTAESYPVSFTVSIPYVPLGTVNELTLLAVSKTNPLARDSVSLNVTCDAYVEDWDLTPGDDLSVLSNSQVTVVFYGENTGLAPDSCYLTISDSLGWDVEPPDYQLILNPGQQDSISFDIQIPGVPVGTTNKITLTGVSLTNPYVADTASLLVTCESYNVTITEISDVGNDQGKQVKIKWSSYPGSDSLVTNFTIFRREDPLQFASSRAKLKAFSSKDYPLGEWEWVVTIPAFGETLYSDVVPTLKDSTIAEGIYWSVFFIRAGTDNPTVYFDSPVDSGYSLDNLSPSAPTGLLASHEPGVTRLTWDMTTAPDFDYYTLYRDTESGFTPDLSNRLGFAIDSTFVDSTGQLGMTYYYLVSATDFSGNESDPSDGISFCC